MNAKAELERMVDLLNGWLSGRSQKLWLQFKRREDLDGVLVFLLLSAEKNSRFVDDSCICWGGGHTDDQACERVIKKLADGSDSIREYLPFTAGSLEELKLKLAAFGREGRSI